MSFSQKQTNSPQRHVAREWQGQDLNPCRFDSQVLQLLKQFSNKKSPPRITLLISPGNSKGASKGTIDSSVCTSQQRAVAPVCFLKLKLHTEDESGPQKNQAKTGALELETPSLTSVAGGKELEVKFIINDQLLNQPFRHNETSINNPK